MSNESNESEGFVINLDKNKKKSLYLETLAVEVPEEVKRYLEWNRKLAIYISIVGIVLGLLLSIAFCFSGGRFNAKAIRGVLAAPIICGFAFYATTRFMGYLFAPTIFFRSSEGYGFLKMLGTQNIFFARIVIFIFILIGLGFIGLIGFALFKYAT